MNNIYDRDLISVEGNTSLKRDISSNAIVNIDKNSYEEYVIMRQKKIEERTEIEIIKTEISELKTLLQQVISKL
jgi:ribosomal protein L28